MAWSIVGVGTSVVQTSGALTVTYPAGTADGDLFVACVTWRTGTAASPTKPAGWATAVEELNSNTLTTDQAMTSGGIYFIFRTGGANPAAGFAFTNVNILNARVVVYRGGDATQTVPAATNSGQTMGGASGTGANGVSLVGLTATSASELIVAAFHGSQESTVTNFHATSPSGNSGAVDTTTAPSTTAWIKRSENTTTTGADCSLAICDAMSSGSGGTGNLICTASVSAIHSICAASFKIGVTTTDGDAEAAGTGGSSVVGAQIAAAAGDTPSSRGTSTVVGAALISATASATAAGTATGEGETFDFLEPDGDVTLDGWTDQASGVVNIFQAIDEIVTNDADFVQSPAVAAINTDFKVRLYKNAVQIAEWVHNNIGVNFHEAEQTLSGAEVAAIGTFEDLFIEFDDNAGAIYRFALADAGYTIGEPVTVTYRYRKLVT